MTPRPPMQPTSSLWQRSGGIEFRPGWFGGLVVYVHEFRRVLAPLPPLGGRAIGSPRWDMQWRWRRARRDEWAALQSAQLTPNLRPARNAADTKPR